MASTINAKNTSTGVVITPDASGQLELQTADTTRMTIDVNGNVGIGTSSPSFPLDVNKAGGGAIRGGHGFNWYNSDNTNNYYIYNAGATGSSNANLLFVQGGVAERMRITSNGGIAFGGASNFGTSGQFLRSNGDAAPTWATPSGGFTQMQIYTSGSGTWTIPAGVTACKITVVGGGGNGGGSTSGSGNASGGGGGGGGGCSVRYYTSLTSGNTINYTVGGAGGTSSVSSGTQTITSISATGGSGGASGAFGVSAAGGAGGGGSGGQVNIGGQGGASGTAVTPSSSGCGGSSVFGGGGAGVARNSAGSTNGNSGGAFGGGGGGGAANGAGGNASGGAGAAGVVIIEY